MLFQPKVLSNRRPQKETADLKATSTMGTMHISDDALKACGFRVHDCIVIASLPVETTGLTPVRPGATEAFYLTKGFAQVTNEEGKVTQKQLGNTITDTNGKNVISAANVYQELGGSTEVINNFDITEAVYGFLVVGESVTPITDETPEDDGDVYAQVVVAAENGQKSLEFQKVADFEAAKSAVPFFQVVFTHTSEKQVKSAAGTSVKTAKAPKAPKAAPVQEVDLDDFEA